MKLMLRFTMCRLALIFGVCIPFAAFNSASAKAETIVHRSFHYFTIHGHTASELDAQLAKLGPKTSERSRHPGVTRIRFSGDLSYKDNGKRCKISRAKVIVNIKIILPRWANRRHASPDLALLWDTLSGDIRRHEGRHAEIAIQHARKLERTLEALPAMSNCKTLARKANNITDREISAHDRDQQRFDRIEAINFRARINRLLRYHLKQANRS